MTDAGDEHAEPEASSAPRRVWLKIAVALALGLGAAAVTWVAIDRTDSDTPSPASTGTRATATVAVTNALPAIDPVALSAPGLRARAASAGQPIYWGGARAGDRYELTRTNDGKVFVRYLPAGVDVGATGSSYLIVATYPFRKPFAALQALADSHPIAIPRGGIAVVDEQHPTSVHVAFPAVDYQIEIYDPSPARALALARSGNVRPVPTG